MSITESNKQLAADIEDFAHKAAKPGNPDTITFKAEMKELCTELREGGNLALYNELSDLLGAVNAIRRTGKCDDKIAKKALGNHALIMEKVIDHISSTHTDLFSEAPEYRKAIDAASRPDVLKKTRRNLTAPDIPDALRLVDAEGAQHDTGSPLTSSQHTPTSPSMAASDLQQYDENRRADANVLSEQYKNELAPSFDKLCRNLGIHSTRSGPNKST